MPLPVPEPSTPTRLLLALALAFAAVSCGPASGTLAEPGTPPPTVEPGVPEVTEEWVELEAPVDGDAFFPDDRFLQIEIELPEESWHALIAAPYDWAPADVVLDGRRIEDVGVRLRGRIGSFQNVWGKPKWKLDFNRYVLGRRVDGLEAVSLDNNVVDCSGLKQMLGFHVLALAGVPSSRAGFAEVFVNGATYGVYNTIEAQDDRFLVRAYEDPSGTLYDGAYVWYGGWDYTLLDFVEQVDMLYELEEGADVGNADIREVTNTLAAAAYNPGFVDAMDTVVDMEAFYPYVAVEHWIGQNDGYVLNRNNYRVYFDPIDGRAHLVSYDLDYAFMVSPWEFTFSNPRGTIAKACFADAECQPRVVDAMSNLLDLLEASDISETYAAWYDATWITAAADPKMTCSSGQLWEGREFLAGWIEGRGAQMRAFWGIP